MSLIRVRKQRKKSWIEARKGMPPASSTPASKSVGNLYVAIMSVSFFRILKKNNAKNNGAGCFSRRRGLKS